jgi:excinuclease UvrABC ATPase subunit
MRKINGKKSWWLQELKDVPKGVCKMCGGKGKYKETFKHKNPIIHHCFKCGGTGIMKVRVKYTGKIDDNLGLWTRNIYEVVSENEDDFVILNSKKEMLQITKKLFELVT